MARPPKGPKSLEVDVRCRCTPEDKERFKVAAARDNMTLSDWFRWLAEERIAAAAKRKKK